MEHNSSISVVSTQMQLVNCIEAIHYYGFLHNELIIWAYSKTRQEQMISLLDKLDYRRLFVKVLIHTREGSDRKSILKSICREKRFFKTYTINHYDAIILGNYKLLQEKYFLKRVIDANREVRTIVVDDGLAACETAILRNNECNVGRMQFDETSPLFKLFYLNGLLFRWDAPSSILFFTSFKNLLINECDSRSANDYAFLKEFINRSPANSLDSYDIIIIGQPLVQMHLLSKESYSDYIIDCINGISEGGQLNIVYIPHPGENPDTSVSTTLSAMISIKRMELPIELYLLSSNREKIKHIVGFYTSALVNIKQMELESCCRIHSLYFNELEDLQNENLRRIIKNAYCFIGDNGISIMN